MPAPFVTFAGIGYGNPASFSPDADPPDPNGAVGPNHYVQIVNAAFMIWDKSAHVVQSVQPINSLWSGYVGTNAGNGCAASNDGDPIVLYDQIAGRWFISQFSLPNFGTTGTPNFQCIAISKTSDPAGAYWLYDFQYTPFNDYAKFGVWPDAYYGTFNLFDPVTGGYIGSDACAFDRASMLAGKTAAQVCFPSDSSVSYIPVGLEGPILPPAGTPGFFLSEAGNNDVAPTLNLNSLHADWTTPANSTFTGPVAVSLDPYVWPCGDSGGTCISQPSPGNLLDSLGDRLMFPATYRNFGSVESIVGNRSVTAGSVTGIRWFEIRSPRGTPTLFQEGTFAPDNTNHRWMASIAQNQAQDLALGYSISSSSMNPSIAWTGRTPADAAGTMGQTETIVRAGTGVEAGLDSNNNPITRWGDYSRMAVDPSDDCTFWYTNEIFDTNGALTWATQISSVKFGNCGANDFSLAVSPSVRVVAPGSTTTFTISSAATAGTTESIALAIQDLPAGVTASFVPPSITAGSSSTLTLNVAAGAAATAAPLTFTVIGKATSAVHAAAADVNVGPVPAPLALLASWQSPHVDVSWSAVPDATYKLFRKQAGADFTLLASPATNSYVDAAISTDAAYVYKVEAVITGLSSSDSNPDLATTTTFSDDPLIAGTTVVRAIHLTELRTAITAVATLAGTGPLTFTNPSLTNVAIKSVHITELRSDLNTALAKLLLPRVTFANSAAAGTAVSAADFTELRTGVK